MVSIHCPPGYEPGALPLRHSAVEMLNFAVNLNIYYNCGHCGLVPNFHLHFPRLPHQHDNINKIATNNLNDTKNAQCCVTSHAQVS